MLIRYTEENGKYIIDCSAAIWSTDKIHNYYQGSAPQFGNLNFLKDTDWVIESDTAIYLVEYKNSNISDAAKPEAFKPEKGETIKKAAEKYFDTLHCLMLLNKNKSKKYIYVVEYPAGNSTSRLMLRNKLKEYLPFKLQAQLAGGRIKLIDEVRVVDIAEWNADAELGKYPILEKDEAE